MQYRPHRYPTDCAVTVTHGGGNKPAKVIDVSRSGARIAGLDVLRRGDKIAIEILSQRLPAVVLWSHGKLAGVTFRPMLSDHLVDVLRKRVDGRARQQGRPATFGFVEMR